MGDNEPPAERTPDARLDDKWEKWGANQSKGPAPAYNPDRVPAPVQTPVQAAQKQKLGWAGIIAVLFVFGLILHIGGCDENPPEVSSGGASAVLIGPTGIPTGEDVILAGGTKLKFDHEVSDTSVAYLIKTGPYNDRWAIIDPSNIKNANSPY